MPELLSRVLETVRARPAVHGVHGACPDDLLERVSGGCDTLRHPTPSGLTGWGSDASSPLVVWQWQASALGRQHARLALASAALSVSAAVAHDRAPGRTLDALARALGAEARGAVVLPADLRWEPSGGAVRDAVFGRGILFLARAPKDETRDVWRARVLLSPEGSALGVWARTT